MVKAPAGDVRRSRGGYEVRKGDDLLNAVAWETGAHVSTRRGLGRQIVQAIEDADPNADLSVDAALIADLLLHPQCIRPIEMTREQVERIARKALESFLENPEAGGNASAVELLRHVGYAKKEARNVVYATLEMGTRRRGRLVNI